MPVASAVAPCHIQASRWLLDVWKALFKHHTELVVPVEEYANTLWCEAMTWVQVIFVKQNVDQCEVLISRTMRGKLRAISKVYYCAQDEDTLVEARFVHEVTHALRYALTSLANSKKGDTQWSVRTPVNPPLTDQMKSLFMLDEKRPHSGYLM